MTSRWSLMRMVITGAVLSLAATVAQAEEADGPEGDVSVSEEAAEQGKASSELGIETANAAREQGREFGQSMREQAQERSQEAAQEAAQQASEAREAARP